MLEICCSFKKKTTTIRLNRKLVIRIQITDKHFLSVLSRVSFFSSLNQLMFFVSPLHPPWSSSHSTALCSPNYSAYALWATVALTIHLNEDGGAAVPPVKPTEEETWSLLIIKILQQVSGTAAQTITARLKINKKDHQQQGRAAVLTAVIIYPLIFISGVSQTTGGRNNKFNRWEFESWCE